MTREERNAIIARNRTTLNATAQAMKIVWGYKRDSLFAKLCLPHTFTAHNRYWSHSYNIKPWDERSSREQSNAIAAATEIAVKECPDKGKLMKFVMACFA